MVPFAVGDTVAPEQRWPKTPTKQWKQKESAVSWRLAKVHIQSIHSEKLLPACKGETMPALAPWIAFFLQNT